VTVGPVRSAAYAAKIPGTAELRVAMLRDHAQPRAFPPPVPALAPRVVTTEWRGRLAGRKKKK